LVDSFERRVNFVIFRTLQIAASGWLIHLNGELTLLFFAHYKLLHLVG